MPREVEEKRGLGVNAMPKKKEKPDKYSRCKICGGKIFREPGNTVLWTHVDKSDNNRPFMHSATL